MSEPRILKEVMMADGKRYIEAAGVATDTKPTGDIVSGSIMTEVDTGKVYLYNEAGSSGSEWVEEFCYQS